MVQSTHKSMVHRLVRHLTDGDGDFSNFFAIILDVFPREIVVGESSRARPARSSELAQLPRIIKYLARRRFFRAGSLPAAR